MNKTNPTFCKLIFMLFSVFCCTKSFAKDNSYIFEAISPQTGFVFNAITSVVSDSKGFVWFGTGDGLYYYNTKEFNKYNNIKHNLPSNKINKLYYGYNDAVWICTDKGICYFDPDNDKFVTIGNNTANASHIVQLSENTFIVVINGKLLKYNKKENVFTSLELSNKKDGIIITCIEKSSEGEIFVGCNDGKLFVAESNSLNFSLIYKNHISPIKSICINKDIIYIGYEFSGVNVINKSGALLKQFDENYIDDKHIPSNRVRKIIKRKNGDIWIGTYNGILVITKSGNHIVKANSFNALPRNSIYDIYVDDYDALWISTWAGGLAYYNQNNYKFISITPDEKPGVISPHFAKENNNEIWIGSEDAGLGLYDVNKNKYVKQINTNNTGIKSLAKDNNKTLWLGTINHGLQKLENGNKTLSKIPIHYIDSNKCIISSIAVDNDLLWLGTRGYGLIKYNKVSKQSEKYIITNDSLEYDFDMIWDLKVLNNGDIAICSDGGFGIFSKKNKQFRQYKIKNSTTMVFAMLMKDEDNIYMGTKGEGILIFNTKKCTFTQFEQNDKIRDLDIYTLIEDKKNNLWFSSNNGIYLYNRTDKYLKHFSQEDNLIGKQFHPLSGIIADTGVILFGGANGINLINTINVVSNPIKSKAFLSKLFINNQPLDSSSVKYVNSKHIANISEIKLAYDKNSLIFEFASNNFMKSKNNLFRYRLINYQNQWIEISNSENITFTKLPYGKYTLEVLCSSNDGIWSAEVSRIHITIIPPLGLRWYFILTYFIVAILITYLILKESIFRMKIKKEIKMERYKNQINQCAFDEKLKFFMNISHELRTPLSLIIAPLNVIENQDIDTTTLKFHIRTIRRNASRMLRLANQILDFRILEVGLMRVHLQKIDIVELCGTICECFNYQIEENKINFSFIHPKNKIIALVDEKMIDKIIYNLLSNAIKFSGEGQTISITVTSVNVEECNQDQYFITGQNFSGKALQIKVFNTGEIIDKNKIDKIFDRFYFDDNHANSGSGIGLHLCLEYTRLHNGHIMVRSDENGTEFIINIPFDIDHEPEKELITEKIEPTSNSEDLIITETNNKNSVIVIVDDNEEIRFYLKSMLSHNYKCVTAKNGIQGIEIIESIIPDIIIMDILMPRMDGIECVKRLRENPKTAQIPVILLTANTENSNQLKGISSGANAFLSKPINEPLLFAHIDRLLSQYKQNKISAQNILEAKIQEFSCKKDNFIEVVQNIIENNIQNEQFDTETICDILNMSRSSLYRKIKSETNQSVTEFIRDYRLKVAVKLMSSNKYNIDEIAFIVGFNSTSYFCRSFKAKYGKTPKDFFSK